MGKHHTDEEHPNKLHLWLGNWWCSSYDRYDPPVCQYHFEYISFLSIIGKYGVAKQPSEEWPWLFSVLLYTVLHIEWLQEWIGSCMATFRDHLEQLHLCIIMCLKTAVGLGVYELKVKENLNHNWDFKNTYLQNFFNKFISIISISKWRTRGGCRKMRLLKTSEDSCGTGSFGRQIADLKMSNREGTLLIHSDLSLHCCPSLTSRCAPSAGTALQALPKGRCHFPRNQRTGYFYDPNKLQYSRTILPIFIPWKGLSGWVR